MMVTIIMKGDCWRKEFWGKNAPMPHGKQAVGLENGSDGGNGSRAFCPIDTELHH
jgi:hypothetical protein